jgi:hypothetical protein
VHHPRCDQCGHEVKPENDAIIIDAFVHMAPVPTPDQPRRHFLPVYDAGTGTMICGGSPSRAQYIWDRPRDPRGSAYIPEFEARYREAFKCVIAEHQARTHPSNQKNRSR